MAYQLEPADPEFFESAPIVVRHTERVHAPVEAVWEALADPAAWPKWFDTVRQGRWLGDEQREVGSTRRLKLGPMLVDEEVIEWDEGRSLTMTVTSTSLPLANRMGTRARVIPNGDGVLVEWEAVMEPRARMVPKRLIRAAYRNNVKRGLDGLQAYLDRSI